MSESMGPYDTTAPESVLDALSPTDDEVTLAWRDACRAHHVQRKALRGLRDGDTVVLPAAYTFTDGSEHDRFIIRRIALHKRKQVVLTDGRGSRYKMPPSWRDQVIAIIRDNDTIETPYSRRRPEDIYAATAERCARDGEAGQRLAGERYGDKRTGSIGWRARLAYRSGERFDITAAVAAEQNKQTLASAAS